MTTTETNEKKGFIYTLPSSMEKIVSVIEVGIYASRHPEFFWLKDEIRRKGITAEKINDLDLQTETLTVFMNIIDKVR